MTTKVCDVDMEALREAVGQLSALRAEAVMRAIRVRDLKTVMDAIYDIGPTSTKLERLLQAIGITDADLDALGSSQDQPRQRSSGE